MHFTENGFGWMLNYVNCLLIVVVLYLLFTNSLTIKVNNLSVLVIATTLELYFIKDDKK